MTIAIFQVLLAAGACYGLWRFWRALDGYGRAWIITAGFLMRALGAEVLFWISWLRLPIARSLQLGDGFWFFAVDGVWYLGYARDLLVRGPKAIAFISGDYPSRIFTQWFTVAAGAFGVVESTAILFNCFLYLAACGLILRIASRDERPRDFALAAIALGPSAILWSLQPLKDTFFAFLIIATVVIWRAWQNLWREEVRRRALSITVCAVAMCYAVYALSGTRWYVGAAVAGGSLLFLGLVANLPRPRLAGSAIALLLFLILGQAFLIGGDLDVPIPMRAALDVRALFHPHAETENAKLMLTTARRGFQTSLGGTMITPGPALVPTETVAELPLTRKKINADLFKPAETTTVAPVPEPVPQPTAVAPAPAPVPAPVPVVAATETVAPAPAAPPVLAPAPAPRLRHHQRKAALLSPAAAPQQPIAEAPAAAPPAPVEPPQSLAAKMATGAAAMFIPRIVAQGAGLVRIGGGRGFWLFADVDTLVFDVVVFVAFAFCIRGIVRKERRVTPLFLLVLLLFGGLTLPMIYSVTNFGTLFRLREMIYVLAAVLPLTLDLRTPAPAPAGPR